MTEEDKKDELIHRVFVKRKKKKKEKKKERTLVGLFEG